MTTTTRPATRRVACPKCAGTGTVSRFLDHDGGVCYDCNGAGTIPTAARPTGRKLDRRKVARAVGDAVLAGDEVALEDATAAFDFFEDLHPTRWIGADCDRRNALGRLIGRIY
jgi:DnaJ-class molecular chaperone